MHFEHRLEKPNMLKIYIFEKKKLIIPFIALRTRYTRVGLVPVDDAYLVKNLLLSTNTLKTLKCKENKLDNVRWYIYSLLC